MGRAKAIKTCWVRGLVSLGMGPGLLLGLTTMDAALALGNPSMLIAQAEAPDPAMPSPNPAPNPVLLGPGANPQEVKILQQQLTQLGFYSGPLDGDYNAVTQAAVKAFQSSAGLTVTGLLDNQTWERMSTPQLLSGADPAAEPEVPSLFTPSSTTEPSTDSPSANDSSADSPSPETADAPSADTSPPQTPTANANGLASETEAPPSRRRARWLWAVLPLAGAALLGLGWGWQRRSASTNRQLPETDLPHPGPEAVSGAVLAAQGAETDPSPADPSPADPLLDRATESVQEGGQSNSVPSNGSSSLTSVPKRAAGSLPVSQPEVARLPTVNIVGTLVGELGSADATVRRRAIWELGQRGNATAIEPLVNGLMEADSQEKSLIFAALAEIGSRSLQPMQRALALGLQDSSPEVRKNAIRDLSRLYDSLGQIRPLLIHATQDPDPEVQATAQWALGQLSRIPPAPAIESSLAQLTYLGDRLPPADSSVP